MTTASLPRQGTTGFLDTPVLGVGLGLRKELGDETLAAIDVIDWLEYTPENYMACAGPSQTLLERAHQQFPLVSHGVSLSIGSVDPLNEEYLSDLEALFAWTNPPWFSDHLSFSSVDGQYFHDLMPLPRQYQTVAHVAERVCVLKQRFGRPFLLENASYYMTYPDDAMSDAAFYKAVVEAADCGMLLDVNNVYVNSVNHGFDPRAYIAELPLERVVQIHVAGHHRFPEGLVDTHGNTVCDDVWSLLEWTLERTRPSGVMIERDSSMPPFAELREELLQLRALWTKTQSVSNPELDRAVGVG